MNEQLIVKNFGPIKDATVDFKKVTVFIGPTGGGKSTLAKLAAIFKSQITYHGPIRPDNLTSFNINNYWQENSRVTWKTKQYKLDNIPDQYQYITDLLNIDRSNDDTIMWISEYGESLIDKILFDTNNNRRKRTKIRLLSEDKERYDYLSTEESSLIREIKSFIPIHEVNYLPSERVFLPAMEYSWAGSAWRNSELPKFMRYFSKKFSIARKLIQVLPINFLDIIYNYKENQDYIKIPDKSDTLRLYEAASGIQSAAPMLVLIEYLSQQEDQIQSFIIEEPELNLYPTAQQALLNWLVEKCTTSENDLTITTHSPYILSSCNLLIEAYKVWKQRPELEEEIEKIVPRASWINPDDFAAYYVTDGTVRPIVDERTDLIGGNELDSISGEISDAFRRLLRLKKQVA